MNRSALLRVRSAAATALRVLLVFLLTFSGTFWVQESVLDVRPVAVAAGADEGVDDPGDADGEGGQGTEEPGDSGEDPGGGSGGSSSSAADPDPEPDPDPQPEPDPGEDPDPQPQPTYHIVEIGVFLAGTNSNAYAFASEGSSSHSQVRAVIDQRGGYLDFDAGVLWDDGSDWEMNSSRVDWSIGAGDDALVRISPSGILEAKGVEDGTVTVYATVDGSYTEDGNPLVAGFQVELRGQTDTKYVTNIVICDDTGMPIDPSYRFEEGTLSTAMLELQARVTVADPATGESLVYQVSPASGLASQTGGELPDIMWDSADTRLGTVSEEGIYRPAVAATNIVYAYSNSGFNGSRVTAQATLDMPPESGKDAVNGYHPQDTITVKVYYEKAPDQLVGEKTFTVHDLEALGTVTQTYTAMRGAEGYMTTTGRGPYLSRVLKAAGVNLEGVARLRFGTPDNYQGVVSWDLLVDTDRYYFPNIDVGSYAERVQVAPMIAIDAYRNQGSDVSPHYEGLTDTRRFLLLFGAKATRETTTNLQVYNIHTLYVELEGSPPVQEDGGKKDPGKNDSEKDKPTTTTSGQKSSSSSSGNNNGNNGNNGNNDGNNGGGNKGNGNGSSSASGGGTVDFVNPNAGGSSGSEGSQGNGNAGGSAKSSSAEAAQEASLLEQLRAGNIRTMTPGRWSALQAINKHPSNVEELFYDNPFAPYAAPTFFGVLAAGGLEVLLRFRWQKRLPV